MNRGNFLLHSNGFKIYTNIKYLFRMGLIYIQAIMPCYFWSKYQVTAASYGQRNEVLMIIIKLQVGVGWIRREKTIF